MHARIHDVETHWEEMGSGTPLVLLHGWGCDWQIWYPLIQPLSEHHTLIIPDLPAFGKSQDPATIWTSNEYVAWLTAFLAHTVGKKSFSLVGHSFGGKLAVSFAAQSPPPPTLASLVLIDAAGLPLPLTTHQTFLQTLARLTSPILKAVIPRTLMRSGLEKLGIATDHFNSSPRQREILQATIRESVESQLPRITVPTLILWGEHDPDTPLHGGEVMAKKIPGAQLSVIPQTGHFPFVEQPQKTLALLTDFISSVQPGAHD